MATQELELASNNRKLGDHHIHRGQPVVVERPNGDFKVFTVDRVHPSVTLIAGGADGGEIKVGLERFSRGGLTKSGRSRILGIRESVQVLAREIRAALVCEPEELEDPSEVGRKIGALLTLRKLQRDRFS